MSKKEESDVVVLEQDLLNLPECYVYQVPPMRSAEGHRAEDWNLPSPLATCALKIIRRDNSLIVKILASRPKKNGPPGSTEQYLFAQSTVTFPIENKNKSDNANDQHPNFSQHLDHSITSVVDSSRYFVIRIQNEKTNREASVGVGFRERDDAVSLKMACMEFVKIMNREYQVLHNITEEQQLSDTTTTDGDSTSLPLAINTKLSLKDGEKIRVNIKIGSKENMDEISDYKKNKNKALIGKGGLFLKKPPPPPSPAKNTEDEKKAEIEEEDVKNVDNCKSTVEEQPQTTLLKNDDVPSPSSSTNADISKDKENEEVLDDNNKDDVESNDNVVSTNVDEDDDEWGDFESG